MLLLGVGWGLVLGLVPAFVMADTSTPSGFVVFGLICVVASGMAGTLIAGGRALRRRLRVERGFRSRGLLAGFMTGVVQRLFAGAIATLGVWVMMTVAIAEVSPGAAFHPSDLMRPAVVLGSFFVSLSVFAYVVAAGVVFGPAVGMLINRLVSGRTVGMEEENVS